MNGGAPRGTSISNRSVNRTFSSERVISVGRLDCAFESEGSDRKLNVEESEKLLIEMISDGFFKDKCDDII